MRNLSWEITKVRERSKYNRESKPEKKCNKESEKNFLQHQKLRYFFPKLIVTQFNSQELSWVTTFIHSFTHSFIHTFLPPTNARCLFCGRLSVSPYGYRMTKRRSQHWMRAWDHTANCPSRRMHIGLRVYGTDICLREPEVLSQFIKKTRVNTGC